MLKTAYGNILFSSEEEPFRLVDLIRDIIGIITDDRNRVVSVLDQLVGSVALAMFGMLVTISFSDKAGEKLVGGDIITSIPGNPQTIGDLSLVSAYVIVAFFAIKIVAALTKFLVHGNKLAQLNKILAELGDTQPGEIDEHIIIQRLAKALQVRRISFWNMATLLNWLTWPVITMGFAMFAVTASLYF